MKIFKALGGALLCGMMGAAVLITGCHSVFDSDDGGSQSSSTSSSSGATSLPVDSSGYVTLRMGVGNSAFRSALPDMPEGNMYFQITAFTAPDAKVATVATTKTFDSAASIYPDKTDYNIQTMTGYSGNKEFKLKVGRAWVFAAQGGSVEYSTTDFKTAKDATAETYNGQVYVSGVTLVYVDTDGTLYDVSATGGKGSNVQTNSITIATTADTTGNGTVSLPIRIPYVASKAYPGKYITSVDIKLANRDSTKTSYTANSGALTWDSGATASTTQDVAFASFTPNGGGTATTYIAGGNYDVTITCTNGSDTLYVYQDTLTVWGGQASHWVDSSSGTSTVTYATNSDGVKVLCFDATQIQNFVRTVFYVAGTGGAITADTSKKDGSLFYPFETVQDAVAKVSDTGADWTILVDGKTTETADFTISNPTTGSLVIRKLFSSAEIGGGKTITIADGARVTLRNVTANVNIENNSLFFLIDNSFVGESYAITVNKVSGTVRYVWVNVPALTGAGTVAKIIPPYSSSVSIDNPAQAILKHYDPSAGATIDTSDSSSFLTDAVLTRFPLEGNYASANPKFLLGQDSETTAATGGTVITGYGSTATYGDAIVKAATTTELTVGGVASKITPTISINSTSGNSFQVTAANQTVQISASFVLTEGGTGTTLVSGVTWSGEAWLTDGTTGGASDISATTKKTISASSVVVDVPENVVTTVYTGDASSYTVTLHYAIDITYHGVTTPYSAEETITLTK